MPLKSPRIPSTTPHPWSQNGTGTLQKSTLLHSPPAASGSGLHQTIPPGGGAASRFPWVKFCTDFCTMDRDGPERLAEPAAGALLGVTLGPCPRAPQRRWAMLRGRAGPRTAAAPEPGGTERLGAPRGAGGALGSARGRRRGRGCGRAVSAPWRHRSGWKPVRWRPRFAFADPPGDPGLRTQHEHRSDPGVGGISRRRRS